MTGDLRSSILTTAAVAASVAGLTVIQPLTAAPPLLLAALLMDGNSADSDGVSGVADTISGKLLPGNSKTVLVNFLTGPFGIWNALAKAEDPQDLVPSTTLGTASGMPFIGPKQVVGPPPTQYIPPTEPAPSVQPPLWPLDPIPAPVFAPIVGFHPPAVTLDGPLFNPVPLSGVQTGSVVTSYQYDLSEYAVTSLLNPFALTNSVAAYLNRALSGNSIAPVNADGSLVCGKQSSCTVEGREITQFTDENGVTHISFTDEMGRRVTATVQTGDDGLTYVTYQDNGPLPLIRPLRDYGGLLGNELADVLEPALTALVYWGYRDAVGTGGAGLLPTPAQTIKSILDFLVGVKQGLESLTKPHIPTPNTAMADAVPQDANADPLAGAKEAGTAPGAASAERAWVPPQPVAISAQEAVNQLTKVFHRQPDIAPAPIAEIPVPSDVPLDDVPSDEVPVDDAPVDETPTSNGPSSGEDNSDKATKAGTGRSKDVHRSDRGTHAGEAGKGRGDTTSRDKTSRDRSGSRSGSSSDSGS